MARKKDEAAATKPPKEPGRIKQMWQVFQMTRRYDSLITLYVLLAVLLPVAVALGLSFVFTPGNGFGIAMWVLIGLMVGILAGLIVLSRRAERAAYAQIEGQPGAVGAVLRSSLRRSWRGSEMPIAVSPRTQDAVYRAVGRGGVVLIGEGPASRTSRMIDDKKREITRILPNVPITTFIVGPDADSVPLHKIPNKLTRLRGKLSKAEVLAVSNRLESLSKNAMPIPKGVDPFKVRPSRAR